jgi:hypothetical protein
MIDFDEIDDWAPGLQDALKDCVSPAARRAVVESRPKYIEDARNTLLEVADRDAVIDATLEWLRSDTFAAYHGTRLTAEEVQSVREHGLLPLDPKSRIRRLTRALGAHPRWADAETRLDEIIDSLANGRAGTRENQVHLAISKAGLLSYSRYHVYGSEFDYHAATELLGDEGQELLTRDGEPCIVRVSLPGDLALEGAHPFFSVIDLQNKGDIPNLVNEFLKAWSFKLANFDFQSRSLEMDCCLFLRTKISKEHILDIEVGDS